MSFFDFKYASKEIIPNAVGVQKKRGISQAEKLKIGSWNNNIGIGINSRDNK
jgi:hypothetical protein